MHNKWTDDLDFAILIHSKRLHLLLILECGIFGTPCSLLSKIFFSKKKGIYVGQFKKSYLNNTILFSMNFGIWAQDKIKCPFINWVWTCVQWIKHWQLFFKDYSKGEFNNMYDLNTVVELIHGLWALGASTFSID